MKNDIDNALKVLRKGGVILYPTDTIWGIGCDATNSQAVERIFNIKRRNDAKSMLSLVDSEEMLQLYVNKIPEAALQMIQVADKPLTIIYDHPIGISSNLLASDGSAGFRITKEPFSNKLCNLLNRPLVSTSANISGMPSPKNFWEIDEEIINSVDYVVEFGKNYKSSTPSNIVKVTDSNIITIIR